MGYTANMDMKIRMFSTVAVCLLVSGCVGPAAVESPPADRQPDFALAIHGGAGSIDREMAPERKAAYLEALQDALKIGTSMLEEGASSLDTVETVIRRLEDDPLFNAGKGAVFAHDGVNELDAAIMDGATLNCGAVTGVTTIKNPITLARRVMDSSPHVFFSGRGAEAFAEELGLEQVDPSYFFTQERWDRLQKILAEEGEKDNEAHGTVGAVALDRAGHLAAATSTGGLTDKRFGRIGDVPVIGAGTYANDATAAVSCTGYGEQFIRNTVASRVSALMEYRGATLEEAANEVIENVLEPDDGGLIAVSHDGEIVLAFNTTGMFRGAADSRGRFEVVIWEE